MEIRSYTPENLRALQLVELDMLAELDRICRKHKIKYIIDAGTLLGAVRHGGFIPWDDDIDVRMLRPEYEKFCEVCKVELNEQFFLQNHETDKGYRWGYARILKNGTVYHRIGQEKMMAKNGVFIDVFPNDNLPSSYWANKECTILSWFCRKLLYSEVGVRNSKGMNKAGFFLLNCLPKKWGHKGIQYLSNKYKNRDVTKVRCFGWGSKEETGGFLKQWNLETQDILFEGLLVRGPKDLDGFLKYSFGDDYMQYPPIEKRKPAHTADYISF